MMIMKRLLFLVSVCSLCMVGNSQNYQPEKHAVVKSDRGDGRLLSTYAIVHEMLKDTHPQYAYPHRILRNGRMECVLQWWRS